MDHGQAVEEDLPAEADDRRGADVRRLRPVLVVDGDSVLATPDQLGGATVTAKVVGEGRGPKINGFVYKPKSNNRKRWGHRQKYTTIEITAITKG